MKKCCNKYRSTNGHKYHWSEKDIRFIKENHATMTNRKLAKALRLSLTLTRAKCYELGLYRMRLEYWTPDQIRFLKQNYKMIGDKELAEIFNKKWKKNKTWTHKHIKKKRNYLDLHRTAEQLQDIMQRNIDQGRFAMCAIKRWLTTGQAKEGTVRHWKSRINHGRSVPRIKINGRWTFWTWHIWKKHHRKIPKGMNLVFKDNNPYNRRLSNLILVDDSELARRNSQISSVGLSDRYVAAIIARCGTPIQKVDSKYVDMLMKNPKLLNAKRQQLLLERSIRNHVKAA